MAGFQEKDVSVEHRKLVDGRGYLRVTHRPSGESVDGYTSSEPMLRTLNRLMEELAAKVRTGHRAPASLHRVPPT